MDLNLGEELEIVRSTAREFAEKELAPVADRIDREHLFPEEAMRKLATMGFCGMLVPEAYGGSGMGNVALAIVLEEINRVCASTGVTLSVHNSLTSSPIFRHGSEDLKKRYLPRLVRGEAWGAYALTEPGAGTDAANQATKAVKKGDRYVLNGQKTFITTGDHAGVIIVFARTGPHKTHGITAFVVESGWKGLVPGKPMEKMGIRGSSTVELFFQDLEVPEENRLGDEGMGFQVAMDTLDGGRIGIAAQAIGILQACLDASVKYAKERSAFGRPIGQFQAIQAKLANMGMDLEAARWLVYRAGQLRDEGKPHGREAAMAKLFASTAANRHAREAVQIHGGMGYLTDMPVERYFRDARITEIYEGTSEVQQLVIARNLLGR